FFIIFFAFVIKPDELGNTLKTTNTNTSEGRRTLQEEIKILEDSLQKTTDPKKKEDIQDDINGLKMASSYVPNIKVSETSDSSEKKKDNDGKVLNIGDSFKTVAEYDSLQKTLPENKRDNWLERTMNHRIITINQKYKGDEERFKEDFIEKFKHSIPQMMFVS